MYEFCVLLVLRNRRI